MTQKGVWCSGKVAPLRGQGSDAMRKQGVQGSSLGSCNIFWFFFSINLEASRCALKFNVLDL